MLARISVLAAVALLGGTIGIPTTAPSDLEGHQSSLLAKVTMTDGAFHAITLQGVGCAQGMCSRVRVRNTNADSVWLDRLASVHDISENADGAVRVVFTFKDGSSQETTVGALNRVLYVGSRLWTRQLDLTGVRRIDFE